MAQLNQRINRLESELLPPPANPPCIVHLVTNDEEEALARAELEAEERGVNDDCVRIIRLRPLSRSEPNEHDQ